MLKGVQVIFCTAYTDFAVDSYDIGAIDYLLKPVPFNRFVKAVQRLSNAEVPQSLQQDIIEGDYIFIKTELKGKWKKIELDELEYLEVDNNYVTFHQTGNQMTIAYTSLKSIAEMLSDNQFVRIHKSYLVAIKQIELIQGNTVILKKKGISLPIGNGFKAAFLAKMRNRLLSD